ncbi:zinc finger BED domain-containing protein 1 [Elysia marginata]|uniref:Zinc finger BED domain-containing protein 1 n=1 Tax=Elysia marginata TaxID=1093978 RepID=A0AAV4IM99_9GAST|nr:zinc finger BED domain-containing protein 1 [Elysia marginata]
MIGIDLTTTSPTRSLVQQTVVEAYDRNRPYDNKSNIKLAIDQALLHMIVEDLQPFSAVEGRWFRNLLRIMDSRYQLPIGGQLPERCFLSCINKRKLE